MTGKVSNTIILFANTDWYLYNFCRPLMDALRAAGFDVLLISPPGEYAEKLRAKGFRWESLPMSRRSLNPFREFLLLWHLILLFHREKPLLVHGFTIKGAVYGSIAARLSGVPARVNAIAGMGYVFTSNDLKARLLRPLVKILLRVAMDGENARLILLNRDDVQLFKKTKLVDEQRIHLILGAGVDCARFSISPRPIPGQPVRILFAGRLLWDKGLAEYIAAAQQLKAEGRTLHFLLAGTPDPGNPASVPEDTVRGWVSEGLVEWLGHVDDMPALLATVNIMVLPSYREGLPTVLIEAGACALPIVTTDVPGCRDVVTHEIDGLLVPVRDARALAQAISRLLDDPALACRLGEAAQKKAYAEFDQQIVIEKTLGIYKELLH